MSITSARILLIVLWTARFMDLPHSPEFWINIKTPFHILDLFPSSGEGSAISTVRSLTKILSDLGKLLLSDSTEYIFPYYHLKTEALPISESLRFLFRIPDDGRNPENLSFRELHTIIRTVESTSLIALSEMKCANGGNERLFILPSIYTVVQRTHVSSKICSPYYLRLFVLQMACRMETLSSKNVRLLWFYWQFCRNVQ
jgi:hypothetical protein